MTEKQQAAEPAPTEEPQMTEPATAEPATEPVTAEPEPEPATELATAAHAPAPEPAPAEPADSTPAATGPVGDGVRPPKDRRVLRAVLRWTAAVAVFAAVASASAYGITGMERTDVPGLATRSDGRWDFPALVRAPLPSGSPAPFAEANAANAHYADLRALLLPAPKGATQDKALNGADGWLPTKDYLAEYADADDRQALGQNLVDSGLRHIAARGWTTQDGTRTRIYLLQFGTGAVADKLYAGEAVPFGSPARLVRGDSTSVYDETFPDETALSGIERSVYQEQKPYGPEQVRQAYLSAGDVFALIVQSRKGGAAVVPFRQTVVLQSQLLG
ncbi:hypothetical protein ACWC24_11190 [Streptomyces sp. NPDC001443]